MVPGGDTAQRLGNSQHLIQEKKRRQETHSENNLTTHQACPCWTYRQMQNKGLSGQCSTPQMVFSQALVVSSFWSTLCIGLLHAIQWRRKWQPTPVFLPGESQGWGSLVGCRQWGRTESDTTEATQQQQQHAIQDQILSVHSSLCFLLFIIPLRSLYDDNLIGSFYMSQGFPDGSDGKKSACNTGRPRFNPWVRKMLQRREWLPIPIFLPGKSHGQRSLAG